MWCKIASKKENKTRFSLGLHLFITYFCSEKRTKVERRGTKDKIRRTKGSESQVLGSKFQVFSQIKPLENQ